MNETMMGIRLASGLCACGLIACGLTACGGGAAASEPPANSGGDETVADARETQTEAPSEAESAPAEETETERAEPEVVEETSANAETPDIPVDQTHNGELDDSDPTGARDRHYDAYPVELQAGWIIIADMQAGGFDTYLYLHDPAGREIASDDDGGAGLNSYLRFPVTASGTYEVRASQFGAGRGGNYTLVLRAGDESSFPASADSPAERARILRERQRRYRQDEHEH